MPRLETFLKKIGIEPHDLSIYRKALTHLSAAEKPSESYERLEFLGDSVIGMVISDFLYQHFKEKEEGGMSRIKAMVVSQESLGGKAVELGLDKFLRADTVRIREGESAEFSILADCYEALVGAIFADRGYIQARKFIMSTLKDSCLNLSEMKGPSDYKSRLQELWQGMCKDIPEYRIVSEEGPDHMKTFTVEVRYNRRKLGEGTGSSKKRAEQEAAKAAYEAEIVKQKKKPVKGKR
jgi:ribonuclease III